MWLEDTPGLMHAAFHLSINKDLEGNEGFEPQPPLFRNVKQNTDVRREQIW